MIILVLQVRDWEYYLTIVAFPISVGLLLLGWISGQQHQHPTSRSPYSLISNISLYVFRSSQRVPHRIRSLCRRPMGRPRLLHLQNFPHLGRSVQLFYDRQVFDDLRRVVDESSGVYVLPWDCCLEEFRKGTQGWSCVLSSLLVFWCLIGLEDDLLTMHTYFFDCSFSRPEKRDGIRKTFGRVSSFEILQIERRMANLLLSVCSYPLGPPKHSFRMSIE